MNSDSVDEILQRADQRFKLLDALSASVVSENHSPIVNKKRQGITNVKRYDGPPPPSVPYTKKPAFGEIVTGPSFKDSVSFWKDRERQNPYPSDDIVDVATGMFKSHKREAPRSNAFFNLEDRNKELVSPVPKVSRFSESEDLPLPENNYSLPQIQEETESVTQDESNEVFEGENEEQLEDAEGGESSIYNDSACFSSWNEKFKIIPNVLTESFEEVSASSRTSKNESSHYNESPQKSSPSVLSHSFVFAKPEERQPVVLPINAHALHESSEFARSLLDDINEEVTQFKTPVKDSDYVVASGDGGRLVHSLSNYRRNEAYVTPVINTAVSTSDVVYALNASKNIEAINRMLISEHEIEKKRKMLGEKVTIYYSQINQMQSALLQVRRDSKKYDLNTEVEVLQQLTVAHLRRNGCYMETNKLQDMKELYYLIPRASIQFSKIAVNLVRHLLPADNCFVFVFVVIRHEEHVYATETRCVNDLLQRGVGVVEFCNSMTIDDVSPDFTFVVDVYGVNINYKDQKQDKKTIFMKILHSPAPDRSTTRQGPDQFSRLGSATITAAEFKRSSDHVLQGVEYPVEGKVVLKYSCKVTDSDPSNWTGLISIYRVVDGRGAWEHSFGRICNGRFSFWRYPEDVDVKEPILSFYIRDMACQAVATTSERVGFQYDFVLKIVDSKDSVVRIMLSTSEESERDRVLHIVNQSYKFTNTWSQF